MKPPAFFVANENLVSLGSDTRVTDGVAALSAISAMHFSDAVHVGNR